ncbi:hypothetical protein C478_17234 [Natrinema thermotolerans DSM 11552]|uniref:hypothetical protein n=1 Tax=unclassified Natrinema TaxID=2622230 RepID=UPI0002B23AC2|nr:hypothetical protein C478_17234 [Natrinema thermotolerans DSM 11552]
MTTTDPESEKTREDRDAVVRSAVADAIFDAVGTLSLLGFSLLFLAVGVRGLLIDGSTGLAVASLAVSIAVAGAAFELVPPFRD